MPYEVHMPARSGIPTTYHRSAGSCLAKACNAGQLTRIVRCSKKTQKQIVSFPLRVVVQTGHAGRRRDAERTGTYLSLEAYRNDRPHPPPLVLGRPPWA